MKAIPGILACVRWDVMCMHLWTYRHTYVTFVWAPQRCKPDRCALCATVDLNLLHSMNTAFPLAPRSECSISVVSVTNENPSQWQNPQESQSVVNKESIEKKRYLKTTIQFIGSFLIMRIKRVVHIIWKMENVCFLLMTDIIYIVQSN